MTGSTAPRLAVALWIVLLGERLVTRAHRSSPTWRLSAAFGDADPAGAARADAQRRRLAHPAIALRRGRRGAARRAASRSSRPRCARRALRGGAQRRRGRAASRPRAVPELPLPSQPRGEGGALQRAGPARALEAPLGELASRPPARCARSCRGPDGELRRIVERLPAAAPASATGVWFSADGRRALARRPDDRRAASTPSRKKRLEPFEEIQILAKPRAPAPACSPRRRARRSSAKRGGSRSSRHADPRRMLSRYRRRARRALLRAGGERPRARRRRGQPRFGYVHGITLGFGATLIGEAVDYAIYSLHARPGATCAERLSASGRRCGSRC